MTTHRLLSLHVGEEEDIDLLVLDKERPAWELSPFTTEYFSF